MSHLIAYLIGIIFVVAGLPIIFHLHSVPWGVGLLVAGALVLAPANMSVAAQTLVNLIQAKRENGMVGKREDGEEG